MTASSGAGGIAHASCTSSIDDRCQRVSVIARITAFGRIQNLELLDELELGNADHASRSLESLARSECLGWVLMVLDYTAYGKE